VVKKKATQPNPLFQPDAKNLRVGGAIRESITTVVVVVVVVEVLVDVGIRVEVMVVEIYCEKGARYDCWEV